MNAVIAAMLERRSIRSYQERQIAPDELRQILEAALYAPTGKNSQNTRFFVIQKPETLAALNHAIQKELAARPPVDGSEMKSAILRARTPGYHFIHRAPTLISAVAPRRGENSMAECAAAAENMLLAASALGLAGCWSNQPHWLTDSPEVRAFLEALGLRDEEDIFASVSIGCPAVKIPAPPPRKEGRVVCDL